ncbi:hypothetical protein QTP86_025520 [Hemibagrus guttatus]|nr:hypothetical protein QTP86_025520 [Hemibagrus guttatus]
METQSGSRGEELKAQGHTQAADAKEDLQESRRIERFDIPLTNLKSMFEKPTTQSTEAKGSSSSTRRVTEQRSKAAKENQTSNQSEEMSDSLDSVGVSVGDPEGEVETIPLKERLALYQAAINKEEKGPASVVMEDSEACSLPGGLASVKKQFESQKVSTSSSSQSTVTQYHYQQRQEVMSSSETSVRSSVKESHDGKMAQEQKIHQDVASSFGNHFDEKVVMIGDQELPKISTQALKQQHEKTIEEATPSKHIKVPIEGPGYCTSPQPPDQHVPQKYPISKEQYSKQRNLYELKRLYKHIHPEVRKNLERDFITEMEHSHMDSDEEVSGDVQQARYVFENNGSSPGKCMSPEREYLEWDEILKGEVQSMRWMFENKPLDTIKDDTPDENESRNIAQQEIIAGKDVKYTTWMFETQPIDALGTETLDSVEHGRKLTDLARGDVRTATWLFETQPLDSMNKIYQEDDEEEHMVYTKDIAGGDVKTARYLFETQHLDSLGHTETIDESHFLQLKSELEEIKGEVKTTTKMFETQPMCVIRGDSGEMLQITTVRREETEKGDVKTSRWLFETQPLDMINKDPTQVKIICGVSMEENYQGGVNRGRWLFETKTLDQIKDEELENTKTQKEEILGADVRRHCMAFETQPMDTLKDNTNARPSEQEEIIGGDVTSARHLFETVPMEDLKELPEVGKLQKVIALEEEKGDVRHQKWLFESKPLEQIREGKKEITRTVKLQELDKGDVINCKEIFETMDLSKCTDMHKIAVEGVTSGSVKSNKVLFESTPLYAIQDSSGQYHEVKTVRREEIVKGDVRSCKWMFETRPIDQFDDSINKFQIIKGISKEEIESGDVKTAKWLFETQPLDGIKYFTNMEEEDNRKNETTEIQKGDVKTCRWLFETQPMDELYEKAEVKTEDTTEIQKGDVKTCTWLFETQTLDSIKDESENILTCTVKQEDVQGKDVRLARFLFETENLENIRGGEDQSNFKRVTQIDIQSGDVSRMKYIFETQAPDIMTSTSEDTMQKLKSHQTEDIQKGNVVNCTWMFENQPIDSIKENAEESKEVRTVTDVQGGNVNRGRFIFETYSLDKIQEDSSETELNKLQSIIREEIERGDVKNYTMMFETQPLYAIRDKEGHFHEVTTVTKEEILRGDVIGARWLFETKPLDSIRDTDEVYLIKAVTEEDIQKGDVSTARWRFETQPLDEITDDMKVTLKTVADIQGGDVKTNTQRFENDDMSQKYVRTVSVSEIQKGDVRSATWMFETRTIDKIHGEGSEYNDMEKVTKEEVLKGDVKQSVWLFEKEPLDRIKDSDGTEIVISREEIPKADVKTTTWLFESTPLTEFNETNVERTEIIGKSVKETLEELYSQKMVGSQGIIIEADEIGDVRMAKYKLLNQETPEIQKEEVIRGDLSSIMLNLLNRCDTSERSITIDAEERGNINTTVKQLFSQDRDVNVEKEEIVRGDIQEAINNLLKKDGTAKHGILIQEDEKGDVRMTIYSLLNKEEESGLVKEDIVKGNVRGTLHRLLNNSDAKDQSSRIQINDTERGNVSFYSTCIESGALDYLRQLQLGSEETYNETTKEKIIGGDVETTKLILKNSRHAIGRTVAEDDIVPGDVHNTVQVFMMEPVLSLYNIEKEEIVKGDLRAALDSLTQAVNQHKVVEKEEVVKGNINTTLRSLEEAQSQLKEMERPEIVRGDIRGALESLGRSTTAKTEVVINDVVAGDIKGTLKSLEETKQAVKEVEKEEIVRGDIQAALLNLQEASTEKKLIQHQVSEQGDVKGTIQLLMEPVSSPHMQRRASTEEAEFFPPPPQDFLPPPPSQQELSSVSQPTPGKPKGRPLFKVPAPEPPKQSGPPKAKWQKKQTAPAPPSPPPPPTQPSVLQQKEKEAKHFTTVTETKVRDIKHDEHEKSPKMPPPPVTEIPSTIPVSISEPKEPPQPKKVFIPPIKLPPPPELSTEPKPRPYARKFKTPLMLAEERYRKQRDEAEKSNTPTSPPESIQIQDLHGVNVKAELTTEKLGQSQIAVEAQQVCPSEPEPVTLPKGPAAGIQEQPASKVAQPQPLQKVPTTFQLGKPSFPNVGKKTAATTDKKQIAQATSEIKVQPISVIPSLPGIEHHENAKASSHTTTSKQTITQVQSTQQFSASVQCQSTDSIKAEETVTEEAQKAPPQPTKIPKVTPSFKVKTFKMPNQEKLEEKKESTQKEQRIISEVCTDQVSSKMQEQVQQITKDTKLEIDLKTAKQKPKKQLPVVAPKPSVEMHQIVPAMSMEVHQQGSGKTTVIQSQQAVNKEHVVVHEEKVVSQSSVQQQNFQQKGKFQIKKQIMGSDMAVDAVEAIKQQPQKEFRQLEIKETAAETSDVQKYEEIQKLLSHIKVMQESGGKIDAKSVKIMLSMIPEWLLGAAEKVELSRAQYNKQKLQEIMVYVRNLAQIKLTILEANLATVEKTESKPVEEKKVVGGTTQKISKISIGSAKVESQKKILEKTVQDIKNTDIKTMSPELRMRTPSPTYICIETAKRTDSPLRVTPSPPPHRTGATPTPPPRWSETSTNISRATPSPTISRSEKLAKLRDTTSKLSHGASPLPMAMPEQIIMQGEMEESHLSTQQKMSFETQMMESSMLQSSLEANVDSLMSVKDKREFFEEAQRAELNRHYMRKDPIDIPERLGPEEDNEIDIPIDIHDRIKEDMPRVDLSRLVNKFESPKSKLYMKKDPIFIPERLGSDTEDAEHELEKKPSQVEEKPSFDIKALKNVFEMGEQAHQYLREDRKNLEMQEELAEPTGFSEANSVTEHYSTVDEFGNTVVGSRSQSASHSQSVTTRRDPPTYADVVRGKVHVLDVPPEASAEQLLKNFQQSWADSENIFKNLGFSVSEQHTSQSKIRVPDNELCRVCRKRVYPMECLIADKQNFHKSCFRCAHCNSQLSETPKKSFTLEEELKVVKPTWPPKEESPETNENTEPVLRETTSPTNRDIAKENQREHGGGGGDLMKALPKEEEQPTATLQAQTDVSVSVEQRPKVLDGIEKREEQAEGESENKVLEVNGDMDYNEETENVEKMKEDERENKGNKESEETDGVKVTVIDSMATGEESANGNANNKKTTTTTTTVSCY